MNDESRECIQQAQRAAGEQAVLERLEQLGLMEYPEHAKLAKVKDESQAIGEFLDWLGGEKGILLGSYVNDSDVFEPCRERTEALLAEFYEIDLKALEAEKLQMLEEQRALNRRVTKP